MLPILPALLFLLLHGPSNIERLAREGRLPAGLEAVHREMAQAAAPNDTRNQAAFVAMLTIHDPCLTQALIGLLQPEEPEPAVREAPKPEGAQPPIARPPTLTDGFTECRRSRDGPRVIA